MTTSTMTRSWRFGFAIWSAARTVAVRSDGCPSSTGHARARDALLGTTSDTRSTQLVCRTMASETGRAIARSEQNTAASVQSHQHHTTCQYIDCPGAVVPCRHSTDAQAVKSLPSIEDGQTPRDLLPVVSRQGSRGIAGLRRIVMQGRDSDESSSWPRARSPSSQSVTLGVNR